MPKGKQSRNRAGMLPGESKRRSLVTVERVARAGEMGEARDRGEMMAQDNYIVVSRRMDGVWTHQVDLRGVVTVLPGKVIDTINRHRESIIKEERSRRAKERVLAQAEAVAQGH